MTSPLRIDVLGPLSITAALGSPAALGSARQRRLLLRLLVADGAVSVDELVDAVWASTPPRSAPTSLRSHVSRLRDVVGHDAVVHTTGGYALADLVEVDADLFEDELDRARVARAAGRRGEARELVHSALDLWRGDALPEVRYEPFAQAMITRLEGLRAVATEEAFALDLECGAGAELVPDLESLVVQHPLREEGHRLLMHALHRAGRTAEALAVYRRARQRFVEELGIEPSPALRELHTRLLRSDSDLRPPDSAWERLTTSVKLPDVEVTSRCDLLLAAGRGHQEAGDLEAARRAFAAAVRAATAADDPDRLARAVLGFVGPPEDSVSVLALDEPLVERALLGVAGDVSLRLQARLAVGMVDRGDPRGQELLDTTVTAARRGQDAATVAYALRARLRTWFAPDDLPARRAASEELVRLGQELGDHDVVAWGRRWRSIANLEAGDLVAVARDLDALAAAHEVRPDGFHGWFAVTRRAGLGLLLSPGPDADAALLQAVALTDRVRSQYTTLVAMLLLWAGHLLGRRPGQLLEVAAELERMVPVPVGLTALALAELGDLDRSRVAYEAAIAPGVGQLLAADTIGVRHLLTLTVIGELAVRLEDRPTAAKVRALLQPYAGRLSVVHPGVTAIGTVDGVLAALAALLGDQAAATAHRIAARRLVQRTGATGLDLRGP